MYCSIFDSLSSSVKKRGVNKTEKYFNPNLHFNEVHFLVTNDSENYQNSSPFQTLILHHINKPLIIKILIHLPYLGALILSFWEAYRLSEIISGNELQGVVNFHGDIWEHGFVCLLAA